MKLASSLDSSRIATVCLILTLHCMLCDAAPTDLHLKSTDASEQSEARQEEDLRTAVETSNFIRSQLMTSDSDEVETGEQPEGDRAVEQQQGRDKRKLRAEDFAKEVFPCNGFDNIPRCLHGGLGPRMTTSKTGKVCTCLCPKDWRGPECSFFNS